MAEQDKRKKELKDTLKIIGSYEGLKTFLTFFSDSVKRALEQEGNAIKQSENIVDDKTDAIKEQTLAQEQANQAKQDELKLEEKKAKLQNMIRENKELMLQDDEIQSLEKEARNLYSFIIFFSKILSKRSFIPASTSSGEPIYFFNISLALFCNFL